MNQSHLNYSSRVDLGGYYTPEDCVQIAQELLAPHVRKNTTILDNACGYGSFLRSGHQTIGCDIDPVAVDVAQRQNPNAVILRKNALSQVGRDALAIPDEAHLAIIGNPPYNDRTSLIRHRIKGTINYPIDPDLKSRDLGISFLLSYDKLKADVVCVLHPLSYLIKPANFKLARNFTRNYRLIDGLLISSQCFDESSKTTRFPIVIALYVRDEKGTSYDDIQSFVFATKEGDAFCLKAHEYIDKYIDKYPRKKARVSEDSVFFWPMRDINALKRNRTFVEKYSNNVIVVNKERLDYYIYVDVFKKNLHRVPYYFGNCNVLIDTERFAYYRDAFVADALHRHPFLEKHVADKPGNRVNAAGQIENYFEQLLEGCCAGSL